MRFYMACILYDRLQYYCSSQIVKLWLEACLSLMSSSLMKNVGNTHHGDSGTSDPRGHSIPTIMIAMVKSDYRRGCATRGPVLAIP
jgi:hypothetical protein